MQEVHCFQCDFPIATGGKIEEAIKCPYCSARGTISNKEVDMRSKVSTNQVSTRISGIGTDFWIFVAGAIAGIIFINPIIAATKAGSKYLEDLAREKIKR